MNPAGKKRSGFFNSFIGKFPLAEFISTCFLGRRYSTVPDLGKDAQNGYDYPADRTCPNQIHTRIRKIIVSMMGLRLRASPRHGGAGRLSL